MHVCYKGLIGSRIFSKKNRIFSKYFFFNWFEFYILSPALFQSLFDLGIAIEIRQVHKRSIKLPI